MATNTDSDISQESLELATREKSELDDYRRHKRMEFEYRVQRVPRKISAWVKHALWEESQKDFHRARSVWERALEVDYANHATWLKFAVMEMRNGFADRARSVFERAIALLPNVTQLWYGYIRMEELLRNPAAAKEILDRWTMNQSSLRNGSQIICEGELTH